MTDIAFLWGRAMLWVVRSSVALKKVTDVKTKDVDMLSGSITKGLYAIANVLISSTVNSFGPKASTGISIANTYDGLMYNICTAMALAVMPYVSQNVGAGNAKRAAIA